MPYGELRVDTLTYTSGGIDTSVTVSGLAVGTSTGITTTGNISGNTIIGVAGTFPSLTGTTTTGVTATFTTGSFTSLTGTTTTGVTATFTTGGFTSLTGTTTTGVTATFTTGRFTSLTGTTTTGVTATFATGVFTASLSGATIISSGVISDTAGNVRVIPQNSKTSSYTLLASDLGKHISITTGGITVPASVFSVGDAVSIYNNSSSSQTITQGSSTTLRQAGTANTGNRTLAQYGIATILCVANNTFVISGAGLT